MSKNKVWAVFEFARGEVNQSVRCFSDVPHLAHFSRLCESWPRPCSHCVPAASAVFTTFATIQLRLFSTRSPSSLSLHQMLVQTPSRLSLSIRYRPAVSRLQYSYAVLQLVCRVLELHGDRPRIVLVLYCITAIPVPRTAVVVVHTLTHRHNTVRGHRTGSNNSGAEDYLRRKTNNNPSAAG